MADVTVTFGADAGEFLAALEKISESLQAAVAAMGAMPQAFADGYDRALAIQQQFAAASDTVNKQVTKNANQAAQDQQKAFQAAFAPIGRAFDGVISGMIHGTETWQKAVTRAVEDVVTSEVEADAKWLAHRLVTNQGVLSDDGKTAQGGMLAWLLAETTKTSATLTGNAARTASNTEAAAASGAADSAAAQGSVMKHAASAAAAVYDDVAQIPYVGWLLAPVAAGAAFAAVTAFGDDIPSFAVGAWDLPSDVSGATLHRGEMVVPENFASGVRRVLAGGDGAAGASATAPALNFNIHAMDGVDVHRVLTSNHGAVAAALRTAWRNASPHLR